MHDPYAGPRRIKWVDEYLESVRETEIKVEKAKKWIDLPLPTVNVDHLNQVRQTIQGIHSNDV